MEKIANMLQFVKNGHFQIFWNLEITEESDSNNLREKPSLGTHTEWEKYLICCNLSKTAISRGFPDFLESGIRKSGNSGSHQKCPKLTYK